MNAQVRLNYFLFARPSFITGVASLLDFGNGLFFFNESPSGEVADYMAIKNDWVLVGEDLQEAVASFAVPGRQLELLPSDIG